MRPTIRVLSDDLIERILDEAMRVLAETGMEIRGPGCAGACSRRACRRTPPATASCSRATSWSGPSRSAPRSFTLYDRDGNPHADLGGDRVHFVPGSSGLKWLDHRTGEVRLADSTDFVEYVRARRRAGPHRLPRDGVLDQRRHRAPGLRRLAPVHGPRELEEAGRLGRLHRARRAAHGRAACGSSARTERTSPPARCRSSRSPRPATSATPRTPARTSSTASRPASRSRSCR